MRFDSFPHSLKRPQLVLFVKIVILKGNEYSSSYGDPGITAISIIQILEMMPTTTFLNAGKPRKDVPHTRGSTEPDLRQKRMSSSG